MTLSGAGGPVAAGTPSPILFQTIVTSTNPVGNGITGRAFVIHTEALPANTTAILGVTAPAAKTVSISDTLAGSWSSAVCSATGGSGNNKAWVFVESLGATGGADAITVAVGSSNTQPVQFAISFFENAGAADGSKCSSSGGLTPSSGGLIDPGSFTPATNNNANGGHIIWSYAALCGGTGANVNTGWTAASGFTLLNGEMAWDAASPDAGFPDASEWETQATNGAVDPSFTSAGETASGDCFNLAAVAVKVANNGAAAPGSIHVAAITHEASAGQTSPFTLKVAWPTVGNLRVLTTTWPDGAPGSGTPALTSLSSSDSCSWTRKTGSSGGADFWYAEGCSACPTCTLSLGFTGAGTLPQYSFRLFDVVNANSSSYQSTASNSSNCATGTNNDMPLITPGVAAGLAIAMNGIGTGPFTALGSGAPSGAVFDLWTFTGQTDSDMADNADGVAHVYFTSNAAQNWAWVEATGTEGCYWAAAVFE